MDYSQLAHDPDNPAGSSPWNTSPRQSTRPSYSTGASGSEPPSPLPGAASYGSEIRKEDDHDRDTLTESDGAFAGRSQRQSQTPTENGSAEEHPQNSGLQDSSGQGRQDQSQAPEQVANRPQHQQGAQSAKSTAPNRNQSGARQSRRNAPKHKLQAKVTGLERPGRKDPILRFDVHVSLSFSLSLPPIANPLD